MMQIKREQTEGARAVKRDSRLLLQNEKMRALHCVKQILFAANLYSMGHESHLCRWRTHTHTCKSNTHTLRRKQALFPLMDDRSCGRRVALKTSRGCGVMKMSDRKQQAIFSNMFNQIKACVHQCMRVTLCRFAHVGPRSCERKKHGVFVGLQIRARARSESCRAQRKLNLQVKLESVGVKEVSKNLILHSLILKPDLIQLGCADSEHLRF